MLGACVDGPALRVRFAPVRGHPAELEDRLVLSPAGDIDTIRAVGRLIRILRAGRVRIPPDPYRLATMPHRAAELVVRCQGARVDVTVVRRIRRSLTIWTEDGVHRIQGVLDYSEDSSGLAVTREGGQSVLYIPRHSLIRYAPSATDRLQVISVEVPAADRLR